jgi:uncharacterized protein YqeY
MSEASVKQRMQTALTAAMRARDEVTLSGLRQALSAIAVAETAGDEVTALSDAQVLAVLAVEVRKYHETADAFVTAGRPEKTERERAEAAVLEAYLPAAIGDAELDGIIAAEIDAAATDGATGMKAMGRVVSAVRAKAGPGADGSVIAARVKTALSA